MSKMADTARSVVLLKSNEAIMIRRYKAMEESEEIHRKECLRLREDMVKAENAIIERVGLLQRFACFCIIFKCCRTDHIPIISSQSDIRTWLRSRLRRFKGS